MTKFRRAVALVGLVVVAAFFALTSCGSSVPEQAADAAAVATVRQITQPLRGRGNNASQVTLKATKEELGAVSVLAGRAAAPTRMASSVTANGLEVRLSRPIWFGRWINIFVTLPPGAYQQPSIDSLPFTTRVGLVPVPKWLARMIYRSGVWGVRRRDATLPDPLTMVQSAEVDPSSVQLTLNLPSNNVLFGQLAKVTGGDANADLTAKLFCYLNDGQAKAHSADFDEQIRRAFTYPLPGVDVSAANRSRLAALARITGGERAARIVVLDADVLNRCPIASGPPAKLGGREDLAQHWAISAALASGLGGQLSDTIGQWKELSDSLPHGSGFSFVDIAADRSGFRYGVALTNASSAGATAEQLTNIKADNLLPQALLANPENMSDKAFREKFQSVNSPRYARKLQQIDAELSRAGVPQ